MRTERSIVLQYLTSRYSHKPLIDRRPMAHDPSFPSKKLVPESRSRNLACVSCILTPDFFAGARNLDQMGSCSVFHQNLESHDLNAALSLAAKFCLHFARDMFVS